MGRPNASDTVCDFASLFAKTVTVLLKCQYNWVAHTGRHSIYSLMTVVAEKVSFVVASQILSLTSCQTSRIFTIWAFAGMQQQMESRYQQVFPGPPFHFVPGCSSVALGFNTVGCSWGGGPGFGCGSWN